MLSVLWFVFIQYKQTFLLKADDDAIKTKHHFSRDFLLSELKKGCQFHHLPRRQRRQRINRNIWYIAKIIFFNKVADFFNFFKPGPEHLSYFNSKSAFTEVAILWWLKKKIQTFSEIHSKTSALALQLDWKTCQFYKVFRYSSFRNHVLQATASDITLKINADT